MKLAVTGNENQANEHCQLDFQMWGETERNRGEK